MKRIRWGWLLGVVLVSGMACESSNKPEAPSVAGSASDEPKECTVGDFESCDDLPDGCAYGSQVCEAGSPNKLGACVCNSVTLTKVGPKYDYTDAVEGIAFGDDAFYWTEYFFVIGAPYTRLIVSKPFGSPGTVLVDDIGQRVSQLHVEGDRIYADQYVYSTDGKYIETLNDDGTPVMGSAGESGVGGASPVDSGSGGAAPTESSSGGAPGAGGESGAAASRIKYTEDGLLLDGAKITSRIWYFQTTDSGVYYEEANDTGTIKFISFDDPENSHSIASSNYSGAFERFAVQGDHLYAVLLDENRVTHRVLYGDLSVLGK